MISTNWKDHDDDYKLARLLSCKNNRYRESLLRLITKNSKIDGAICLPEQMLGNNHFHVVGYSLIEGHKTTIEIWESGQFFVADSNQLRINTVDELQQSEDSLNFVNFRYYYSHFSPVQHVLFTSKEKAKRYAIKLLGDY